MQPLPVLPERERGVCCAPAAMPDAQDVAPAVGLLRALADPARLRILAALRRAEAPICICDFTAALDVGQSTVSHHMARLRDAGLVQSQKRGLWAHYSLRSDLSPSVSRMLDAVLA